MDNIGYTTLTRQSGLMREMQVVANNIANMSTTGFRREGVIFSEHVARLNDDPSLSMALGHTRSVDLEQGSLTTTRSPFDFAIQGEGFFQVSTPDGPRLTRAGSFTPSATGELVNMDGHLVLDGGGAPIFIPPDGGTISLGADGTLMAGNTPVAKVGLWQPTDPLTLRHEGGTLFSAEGIEPAADATIFQGMLEDSNVEPVSEIARMITVQRAYEMGQKLLDSEDARVRGVIQTLGR
jgi:flagellar basal-body rod protein FlgF